MKLNLDCYFKDLEGKEITDITIGAFLSRDLLAKEAKGIDPIKAWDWALTLTKNREIEVDRADMDMLIQAVSDSSFANLVKAQVLLKLRECKEKEADNLN